MGFFEKVKNMFTEEVEDDEIKEEKIKKEVTHVTIEPPITNEKDSDDFTNNFSFKSEVTKPVFFDDNDFKDLNLSEEKKVEMVEPKVSGREIYGSKISSPKAVEEKKVFKPTPIISPVYGILDKNYHKEDIVSRSDIKQNKIDYEVSIDSIRDKAYGTLEDELENTLFGSNSILFKKEEPKDEKLEIDELDDDILTDLTDDIGKELDELLIKKEKYVESEKLDKSEELNDEDLLGFIDSTLYKDGDDISDDRY